jgi:hypothetical protein
MTTDQFKALMNLGLDAVEQAQVDQISKFADLWLKTKFPISRFE